MKQYQVLGRKKKTHQAKLTTPTHRLPHPNKTLATTYLKNSLSNKVQTAQARHVLHQVPPHHQNPRPCAPGYPTHPARLQRFALYMLFLCLECPPLPRDFYFLHLITTYSSSSDFLYFLHLITTYSSSSAARIAPFICNLVTFSRKM